MARDVEAANVFLLLSNKLPHIVTYKTCFSALQDAAERFFFSKFRFIRFLHLFLVFLTKEEYNNNENNVIQKRIKERIVQDKMLVKIARI